MSRRYIVVTVVLNELEIVGDDQWPMRIWIVVDLSTSPPKQVGRGYPTPEQAEAAARELNEKHEQELDPAPDPEPEGGMSPQMS